MAISFHTAVGTYATVSSPGTAVSANVDVFDNTHTIIIYNPDTTNTIYVAFLSGVTSVAITSAIFVPPSSSVTLAIGCKSSRPSDGNLLFDASGGTPTARITYINGLSS